MKGTYTVSGSNITTTVTELHGNVLNGLGWEETGIDITFQSKWYTKSQVMDAFVDALKKMMKEQNPSLTDAQINDIIDGMSDEIDDMYEVLDAELFPTETVRINSNNTITDSEGTVYTKVN